MLCFSLYSLQSITWESSGENSVESRFVGIKRESSGGNCVESRFVGIERESSGEICVETRSRGIKRESSGENLRGNSLAWYQAGVFG